MNKERRIFEGDGATTEWLNAQKKSTKHTYKSLWKEFLAHIGMTGDQILADRKTDNERRWEKTVEKFNVEKRKTCSSNKVKTLMGAIRGFFSYHYTPLVFRRADSRKLTEARRNTSDYLFTKEDLYAMWKVADPIDRYIVASKCLGFRALDFIKLTRGHFESYLNREAPVYLGELPTIKESVSAHPFLDSDAVEAIKTMLTILDSEGKTDPKTRILSFKKAELTTHLQKLAEKAGIKNNGKVVRFHCLRKFLTDRLSSVMSESKWKQIVGKQISEGAYVSPELLREDYKRALKLVSFNQQAPELEEFKEQLKAMQKGNEELDRMIKSFYVAIEEFNPDLAKKVKEVSEILRGSS